MAWQKIDTNTLGSSGDNLDLGDVTPFTATTFMFELLHVITTGGVTSQRLTYNNDNSTNYAGRKSLNGGAESTSVNATSVERFNDDMPASSAGFTVFHTIDISGEEKLGIVFALDAEAAGSGTSPSRDIGVYKWANSVDQITRLDHNNSKAGSFDTDSNVSLLGTD